MQTKTAFSFLSTLALGLALLAPATAARADTWVWSMSGIHGGGTAQVLATDPFNAGGATIGGDSWGVYNTTDAGNQWHAATKGLGLPNQRDPFPGDFFFMGLAYSKKIPGRVYALTGKLQGKASAGNFGYIQGDAYTVITRRISGSESADSSGSRKDRPRPTGKRVVADFDAAQRVEWLYVGAGGGRGVLRSADDGATWTCIGLSGLGSAITGMCLDPADPTTLYVATQGDKAYRLTDIRGAAKATPLNAAPTRVEEVAAIGDAVYAVAHTDGVFKLSNRGEVWTPLGGKIFTETESAWSAIGGEGKTLYVGGAAPRGGKSIAKSTDGGATWAWVTAPGQIHVQVWGRKEDWWLPVYRPRVLPGADRGSYESTEIEVDHFNPDIVYSCGRSGCWKSEDGGQNWRPAMNGLGGSMHTKIAIRPGGVVETDDVDFTGERSRDHFATAEQATPSPFGENKLSLKQNGHSYRVVLTAVRDFTVDGVSIGDEFFRATCVRPSDIAVTDEGDYIYIAQFGGGVLVGHRVAGPVAAGDLH